jgi:SAM-dependent methyltransferase
MAPEAFEFISCLGVLHHLEQPRQGFDALVDLLAPGGLLLVYLYSRPSSFGLRSVALRTASGLRRATTKFPAPLLRTLSWPTALVLWLTVVRPGALLTSRRGPTDSSLPLAAYHGMPIRSLWLDTFDRLSAPIEHRYVWEDLRPWYAHRGLVVDAMREESGLFVLAHRP